MNNAGAKVQWYGKYHANTSSNTYITNPNDMHTSAHLISHMDTRTPTIHSLKRHTPVYTPRIHFRALNTPLLTIPPMPSLQKNAPKQENKKKQHFTKKCKTGHVGMHFRQNTLAQKTTKQVSIHTGRHEQTTHTSQRNAFIVIYLKPNFDHAVWSIASLVAV